MLGAPPTRHPHSCRNQGAGGGLPRCTKGALGCLPHPPLSALPAEPPPTLEHVMKETLRWREPAALDAGAWRALNGFLCVFAHLT